MKELQPDNRHGRSFAWLGVVTSFLMTASLATAGGSGFGVASASGSAATGGVSTSAGGGHGGAAVSSSGGGRGSVGARSGGPSFGSPGASFGGMHSVGSISGPRVGSTNFGGARVGTIGGNPLAQNQGTANAYRSTLAAPQHIARANNPWSEVGTQANRATTGAAGRYPYVRGNVAGNVGSYNRLYPGSYGSGLRNYGDARGGSRRPDRGDHHGDHSHYGYGYGHRFYYPYYLNNYGYYPYLGGSYGYYGGDTGVDSSYADVGAPYADGSLTPDDSTYDGGSQPVPRFSVDNPNDSIPAEPAQPPPVARSQTPWADQQETAKPAPSLGPDSLVEAVQDELSKRGYYQGKIDAMFSPNTKEAVRHFQADNQLVPTGLLNNSTLTMLGLN